MQTFAKSKVALAVGAALMVMAGAAQAVALTPLAGASKTLLAITEGGPGAATAADLYDIAGTNKPVKIGYLATTVIASGGAITVNTGTTANDDVTVLYGTTIIPQAQLAVAFNDATVGNGVGNIVVTITPAGTAKVRLNNANGSLEYTANGTVAAPVWAAVNMTIQAVGGNALTQGGAAIDAATAVTTAFASNDFILGPAAVKTYSVAGADKVSGLTVDFRHPVATPSKTTLSLNAVAVAPLTGAGDISNSVLPGVSAVSYAASAGSTTAVDVALTTPANWDWNGDGTIGAADALLYVPLSFNTGVTTPVTGTNKATPLSVSIPGTGPAYANIYAKVTGVAATVAPAAIVAGAIDDGAAPVIVADNGITFSSPTGTPALTNLAVTFSEPLAFNLGDNTSAFNLREVLENIKVGSDTLAALELNAGTFPALLPLTQTAKNQGTLTVTGVLASDVATPDAGTGGYIGKSIAITQGITYQEINDQNYAANLTVGTTLDDDVGAVGAYGENLEGGVKSATGAVEAIPATPVALTAVAPPVTVVWGTDTNALASGSAASPELIDTVTVTFDKNKSVMLRPAGSVVTPANLTAATAADLAANLVLDVRGTNGIVFQARPVSATLTTTAGISTIAVVIPTKLIYSKLEASGARLQAMYIGYVGNNVLVATSSTLLAPISVTAGLTVLPFPVAGTDAEFKAAGAEPVVLPLVFTAAATGNQSTLLTQDIQGTIAGATVGSIVNAYLATWSDAPTTSANPTISSGKITNPGDKVATDLAIEFADKTALTTSIQNQLNNVEPAKKAKPGIAEATPAGVASSFPVYVKLVRSSDTQANTKGSQNYLESRAILATTYAAAYAAASNVPAADVTASNAAAPTATSAAAVAAVIGTPGVSGAAVKAAYAVPVDATPAGALAVAQAVLGASVTTSDPVYEVMLNPTTGAITGRLTGNIKITPGTIATANRGLRFLDMKGDVTGAPTAIGSSLVGKKSATDLALPGTANVNLLMGIDPSTNDLAAIQAMNPFVLLVLRDSTGKYTQLTSANPLAANYLPFAPDVLNKATGTGGIAKRAPVLLSVTDVKALPLPASPNWALYGVGNRALAAKPAVSVTAVNAFPRDFVGLNTATGLPMSFWTNDGATFADMALSMAGNQVGVATDLTTTPATAGATLSTIGTANMVKGAQGLAWFNENGGTDGGPSLGHLYVAQATGVFAPATAAPAPTLNPGWSLVNVPGVVGAPVAALGTVVDAVIKVGAQVGVTGRTLESAGVGAGAGTGQFTWLAEDGAMPALTAGEAVFVHAKAKGSL